MASQQNGRHHAHWLIFLFLLQSPHPNTHMDQLEVVQRDKKIESIRSFEIIFSKSQNIFFRTLIDLAPLNIDINIFLIMPMQFILT